MPIASEKERDAFVARRSPRLTRKVAPLKKLLGLSLIIFIVKRSKAKKLMMLSAEECAVVNIPRKRSDARDRKSWAKGLETSMRITWEEVAEAVASNSADHALARAV